MKSAVLFGSWSSRFTKFDDLFGRDLFNSAYPNHLALFHIDVVVEKIFDLKLISVLIVVADRDRNLYFKDEILKPNFLASISIGCNSILPNIASRKRMLYKRFQIVRSDDQSI